MATYGYYCCVNPANRAPPGGFRRSAATIPSRGGNQKPSFPVFRDNKSLTGYASRSRRPGIPGQTGRRWPRFLATPAVSRLPRILDSRHPCRTAEKAIPLPPRERQISAPSGNTVAFCAGGFLARTRRERTCCVVVREGPGSVAI